VFVLLDITALYHLRCLPRAHLAGSALGNRQIAQVALPGTTAPQQVNNCYCPACLALSLLATKLCAHRAQLDMLAHIQTSQRQFCVLLDHILRVVKQSVPPAQLESFAQVELLL